MRRQDMDQVTISRTKIYPTPGKNYRAAWKWLYTVHVGTEEYTGEGLSWAKRLAKIKAPNAKVALVWEGSAE
jgi:hypothetical protein